MAGTHRASVAYADPLETSGGSEREGWGWSRPWSKWNHGVALWPTDGGKA